MYSFRIVIAILLVHQATSFPQKTSQRSNGSAVFCYYGSWASYRWGVATFNPENIDPTLCSHIIYAFTGLKNGLITSLDEYNDYEENWGKGLMKKFTTFARSNNIKSLVAVGGWNEGSAKYSQMVSTAEGRENFANSAVALVEKRGFDGLDLDWEYPTKRGGSTQDKTNYILLLKILSQKLHSKGYLLTVAVSADPNTITDGYDIPNVSRYVDFITVMTFDYHTASSDSVTGLISPLDALPHEVGYSRKLNIKYSINMWLEGGAQAEKLLIGTPMYGRTYRLKYNNQNTLGAPIDGPGDAGRYSGEAGFLAYYEICSDNSWDKVWNVTNSVLYAYKNYQWVSYDDCNTIAVKIQWAVEHNLGGVMIWSLESDDFNGICGGEKYPLLKSINRGLGRLS